MSKTMRERVDQAQRYNKALAAAIVTLATYVASLFSVEVPADVALAATTVLVLVIPNRGA